MTDLAIADIIEGVRHRHDLGDIKALAESMTEVGLLHPVVVTEALQLIAGGRRLAAARSLGWLEVPVTVVSNISEADTILQAESDENTCRKDFTPTEASSIKRAREGLLKPISKPGPRSKDAGNLPASPIGRVRDIAARGTGFSSKTLKKVETIQVLAESPETPAPVRGVAKAALAEMDRTGKVDKAFRSAVAAVEAMAPVSQIVNADERLADLNFQAGFARDLSRAHKAVLTYDAAEVGRRVEPQQLDSLDELAKSLTAFAATARSHVAGLRLVSGENE